MSSARDFQEVSAAFETQCYFTAPLIFLTWTISIIFLIFVRIYKMALWKCIALLSLFLFFSQICSMPTKCNMRRSLVKVTHNLLENMVSWVSLSFPPCSLYFLSLPYLCPKTICVFFHREVFFLVNAWKKTSKYPSRNLHCNQMAPTR